MAHYRYHRGKTSEDILNYRPSPQSMKESKGRNTTSSIQNIKNSMYLNEKLKVKDWVSQKAGYKAKRGRIVGITDSFIILQTKNYKECFRFSDFLTRKTIVEA